MNVPHVPRAKPGKQRGQSTVEFMLMIPIVFSMLFFVIEMGLYFTATHYGTYAAFATARSQEVGYSQTYSDATAVSNLILTGDLWGTAQVNPVDGSTGISVQLQSFETLVPFPFIVKLLPDMKFDTRVHMGPIECQYEYAVDTNRPMDQYDNNINPSMCAAF